MPHTTPPDFGHDPDPDLVLPEGLTRGHRETIAHFRAYNVPAEWFVKPPDAEGRVSVIAVGNGFAWSLVIEPDGDYASSEATLGPWETGISC